MKKALTTLIIVISFLFSFSQKKMKGLEPAAVISEKHSLSKTDLQKMKLMEDTLHHLSNLIVYDSLADIRKNACYAFIPKFVAALKLDNSFYYPFDSLETIAKIYPKDSTYRIFTWQLKMPQGHYRYYGVIQMRSTKIKIFPLYDMRDTLGYQTQLITSNNNWYGCLYYNVVEKQVNNQPVYTLFGYEAADYVTRRKVVDVLTFDNTGKPRFGAPIFYFKYDDTTRVKQTDTLTRFFMEYKHDVPTVLNYDRDLEMIVFDHVAPPNDKAKGATFTYVPDGTYEGFLWANNRWNWVEKVFTFAINEDDNPPIPAPLFGQPKRQPVLPGDEKPPK